VVAKKKQPLIRRCAIVGRDKCNECDQAKHSVDDCDILAQKQRREEKRQMAEKKKDHVADNDEGLCGS
jgi:hypothetical protein